MGMQGCFISVSDADLDAILEDPARLRRILEIELSEEGMGGVMDLKELKTFVKQTAESRRALIAYIG
jgi:hypothetical protein